jgi:integrase
MVRWQIALDAKLVDYRKKLTDKKRQEDTKYEYNRLIWEAFEGWADAGFSHYPRTIGEDEIYFLQNELWAHLQPDVARRQISIVGRFLKKMGNNPIVDNMDLEWPESMRINAVWLPPIQAMALLKAADGLERIVIHSELCLLMRRCEVRRAEIQHYANGRVEIWGKGRSEGKPRTIPWAPRTAGELKYYMDIRKETIRGYRNPPKSLLVYERNGKLGSYQNTKIDSMIKDAARRAGIDPKTTSVSNHVLRRTGALIMKLSNVPTITIMTILGHKTEQQTLDYIGWGLFQMAEGFQQAEDFMQGLEKNGMAELSGYFIGLNATV